MGFGSISSASDMKATIEFAGLRRALEIDVVHEGAHEFIDDGSRQVLLERRLVEALIERDAAFFVVVFVRFGFGGLACCELAGDRRKLTRVVDRNRAFQLLVRIDRDPYEPGPTVGALAVAKFKQDLLAFGGGLLTVL